MIIQLMAIIKMRMDIYKFPINKDSAITSKDKQTVNFTEAKSIPSIWSPNKAFGFETTPKESSVVFKNATVWTNDKQGVTPITDVIIHNGKILAIGTMQPLTFK